jgi:hypothetical protein
MAMRLRRPTRSRANPAEDKVAALVDLAYELLDAHADTARLAVDDATDDEWRNHLSYLRDLQRVGRGALARVAIQPPARSTV